MEIQKILFVSKWRQNWSVAICFRTISKQTEPHGGSRGPCSWAWAARKHARHRDLYSYFCSLVNSDWKNCLSDPVCKLCFQSSPSVFWRAYADSLFIYSFIAHVPFLFYAESRKHTSHSSLHWVSASLVVDVVWVRGTERLSGPQQVVDYLPDAEVWGYHGSSPQPSHLNLFPLDTITVTT